MISIKKISPNHPQALKLIEELDYYENSLYPQESIHQDKPEDLLKGDCHFLGAFEGETLLGIGAVKVGPERFGERKRLYVTPSARGKGIASSIIAELERFLVESNIFLVRLETGIHQEDAIKLNESLGYKRIGPFGSYVDDPLSVFMEKDLSPRF